MPDRRRAEGMRYLLFIFFNLLTCDTEAVYEKKQTRKHS